VTETTTYKHVKLEPFDVKYVEHVKISSKINKHTEAEITALLPGEGKDALIYNTGIGTIVKVSCEHDDSGYLFIGVVKKIKIKAVQNNYYLIIKALSETSKMDVKRKCRSFQDKSETYRQIIDGITGEYPQGGVIDTASDGKTTEKFLMQYEETDWQYVMRLCSLHNAGLVPAHKNEGIKYFFGIPDGENRGNLEQYNFTTAKLVTQYLREKENENPDITELDKVYFEVETGEFFNIGDSVSYQDASLRVNQSVIEIKKSVVRCTYRLTTKKGCSKETFYNDKIIGLSIKGNVIKTEKDEIKLHLNIDESQDVGKAHFFRHTTMYTASGNSGLYCMPELGDTLYAHFPTKKEWEGVTQNSIRDKENGGDKISDPDTKYWRTKNGKEIKLDPKEMLLTCVDDETYIKLNEDGGISIFSVKPIKITTMEDLNIESQKNINMTAKDEITLTCKSSTIKMDGNILIKGKEVRHN